MTKRTIKIRHEIDEDDWPTLLEHYMTTLPAFLALCIVAALVILIFTG